MRQAVWSWLRRDCPIGQILPWWMRAVRCLLFPLDSFYWWYSAQYGYDIMRDEWIIHGVRYSNTLCVQLAQARGELVRIERRGDVIVMLSVKEVA